ncbi:Cys-tRNA(Pro) deacylase [Pseudactinotalea sp. HY158]|uniref:Cys-tRNA(Pro) deacylase n=1 Tax=Pseudactinotalea sp. HY158 TaxID=2654547 RepID=UPI00129D022C|nr:Cys-tRNA(Pro) deacylase [Pseudactinotalea sp. HY158]QGH69512.1 Cys-tRNA(Pro) deacylase [Pseudactinotalea sp. HY158]
MPKKPTSGSTPAVRALLAAGVAFTERPYDHDPAAPSFGLEAAAALGRDPSQVFKTLLVDAGSGLAVGIVPVSATLDLKAMGAALGVKKVAMAAVADAERVTGYVAGGISPIGQRRALPTVLDSSAGRWTTLLVSGGRRGLDIELAPADLAALTRATRAAIASS